MTRTPLCFLLFGLLSLSACGDDAQSPGGGAGHAGSPGAGKSNSGGAAGSGAGNTSGGSAGQSGSGPVAGTSGTTGGTGTAGGAGGSGGASAGTGTGGVGTGGAPSGGAGAGGTETGGAGAGGTAAGAAGSAGSSGGSSGSTTGGAGAGGGTGGAASEWLPSWATSIQRTEERNLPTEMASYLRDKTMRQFVWPTFSGTQLRLQLSNEKGTSPVQIQKVHIARAMGSSGNNANRIDTATDTALTFGGMASVTIPAGQTVWSDPASFNLEKMKLTAITMLMGSQVPNEVTGHPGARTTTHFANNDVVSSESISTTQALPRWYFINAIEVMARPDAFAIAALGDSITDGYGIVDTFERWTDFLTIAIQEDPNLVDKVSVLNFGMGANLLTRGDGYQDAGVDRFQRDVLKRDKIKWLIVLEGVNDINASVSANAITSDYQEIITAARAKGIKVYGSPITPMGSNNSTRNSVNDWVRTMNAFDAVIDFDAAIRDPGNPHSIRSDLHAASETLHPNAAGYEVMGKAVDLSLFHD